MPRIGDLNRKCEFQAPSKVPDNMGGSTSTFVKIFDCLGKKKDLAGTERVAAMQAGGIITGTLWIRWRPVVIRTSWRVLYEGKYLSIVTAIDTTLPEGRFLQIKVKEVL